MSIRHNFLERTQADVTPRSETIAQPYVRTSALLELGDFKNLVVAHWRILTFASLIALMAGFAYSFVAEREYSAAVKVRVDLQKTELLPSPNVASTFLNIESALLEGDVELARSMSVLRAAASKINLDADPDYNRNSPLAGLRAWISGLIQPAKQEARRHQEIGELRLIELADRTRIDRVGQSLLIRFAYRSSNPDRAAHVANAIAEAFIDAQLLNQKQSISKITASLQDRLGLMREEVAAGDIAVARFKSEHVLAEAPGGSELERQLADLNNQAAAAKAEAAAVRARFQRLSAAADALDIDAVTKVDGANQTLSALHSDWKRAVAQNDPDASARVKENILQVIGSLARSRRAAVEFAESRASQLSAELERVKEDVRKTAIHHVELAELQRHAESRRVIYEATLTAFNRFVQNEALPVARFKIAEEARPPALPHWPKTPLIMASMLLLGLSMASGYILLREGLRQTFLGTKELSRAVGLKSIAAPQTALPEVNHFDGYAAALWGPNDRMRASMVRLQHALGIGSSVGGLVVGVTSAVEHEGKTSVTGLLGAHLASLGMRVLLVDLASGLSAGDGALSRRLNVEPSHRRNGEELPAFIHRVADNVHLLSEDNAGLCLHGMRSVFSEHIGSLRNSYDIVLVDLPILDEARHLAAQLDKALLVVEWNRTTHDQVIECLECAPAFAGRVACAVLNKVQWRKIRHSAPVDFERLRPSLQSQKPKSGGAVHEG